MDHDAFDRLGRLLATSRSRRTALAAMLSSGVLGGAETVLGKGKGKGKNNMQRAQDRDKRRDKRRKGNRVKPAPPASTDTVAVEASCSSPGPSSNLNTCNFTGRDLDGCDLSGSSMKNTRFNNASLCGDNLSSATLTNAEFKGATLTKANLGSSACRGLKTNAATRFCRIRLCSGAIDNSDCPTGVGPITSCTCPVGRQIRQFRPYGPCSLDQNTDSRRCGVDCIDCTPNRSVSQCCNGLCPGGAPPGSFPVPGAMCPTNCQPCPNDAICCTNAAGTQAGCVVGEDTIFGRRCPAPPP